MTDFQNTLDTASVGLIKKLEREVGAHLRKSKWRIAIAESMTGGDLSHRLSRMSRGSDQFAGAIICPNAMSQIELLGVSPKTIREKSELEGQVAKEMLNGVSKRLKADLYIATSGVNGLTPQPEQHMLSGQAWIAFDLNKSEKIKSFTVTGSWDAIREKISASALMVLQQWFLAQEDGQAQTLFDV